MDVLFCLLCFEITSFLPLTFSSSHAGVVSSFLHSLSTAAFSSGIFHHLWHKNELVHHVVMCHRSFSFACNVVFVIFR